MPRDYERFALDANKRRADMLRERPGVLNSVKRGMVQFPGDVLGMTPSGRRPSGVPGMNASEFMNSSAVQRSEIPEPVTYTEAAAERFGRTLPFTLLTAPAGGIGAFATEASALSGAANAAKFIASEVGQDLASTFAEQAAQEYGAGGVGQFAAGTVAGGLIPSPRSATGMATSSLGSGRRGVRRLTGDIKEVFRPDDVAKFAKSHGYTYAQALGALEELFGRLEVDPLTGFRDLEGALKQVNKSRKPFEGASIIPPVPTLIGEAGGQGYSTLTRSLTRGNDLGPGFGAAFGGRVSAITRDIDENIKRLTPDGSADTFFETARSVRDKSKDDLQPMWVNANLDRDGFISIRGPKRAASAHFVGNPTVERKAPAIAREILNDYPEGVSLRTFQDIKADLGYEAYKASQEADYETAKKLGDILEEMQKQVENLAENGSSEYRAAIRATKEHHRLYDARSHFVGALERGEYGSALVGGVMRPSRKLGQAGEARVAMNIAKASGDDAVASLKHTFMEDLLFNADGSNRTVKQIRTKLRNGRKGYEVIIGSDDLAKLENLISRRKVVQFMDYAGSAEARRAGSGVGNETDVAGAVLDLPNGVSLDPATLVGVALVKRTWRRLTKDRRDATGILQEMLLDDKAWEELMRIPQRPSEAVEYVSTLERMWARSQARAKLRARSRGVGDARRLYRSNLSPTATDLSAADLGLMNREEQRNNANSVVAPLGADLGGGVR